MGMYAQAGSVGTIADTLGLTGLDATSILSIALWWRCRGGTADIFAHRNNTGNTDGYFFWWDAAAGTGLKLRTYSGATPTTYAAGHVKGWLIGSGLWNHLAVSLDGSTVRFFVNGQQINAQAQTANATVAGTRKTLHANVGLAGSLPQGQSDCRVWNGYAITAADAMYIAQGGVLGNESGRWFVGGSRMSDLTKNGNTLTVNGVTAPHMGPDPDIVSPFRRPQRTVGRTAAGPADLYVPLDMAHTALHQNLMAQ